MLLRLLLPGLRLTLGWCCFANFASATEKPIKPNIIVIMTDDMAQQDLSIYGQKAYATPNLDRLARNGMVFTNGYAGAPVCAPSRATFLTGLHTGHSRVRALNTLKPGQPAVFLKDDVTIAELLKGAGYRTGIVGKWGLGSLKDEGHPLDQGFDFFFGFETHGEAHNYFPTTISRNRERINIPENQGFQMKRLYRYDSDRKQPPTPKDFWTRYQADGKLDLTNLGITEPAKAKYSQDLVQEAALSFLQQKDHRPFFLFYATQIPHGPVIAKNLEIFCEKPWPQKHKEWAAMQTTLDQHVGALVTALEKNGQRERTLIVFTSDNGVEPGYLATKFDKEMRGDDPILHNAGPGRGSKYTHYERGMRVPLFFNAPWIPAGKTSQIAANYDLMPTFASLAGVKVGRTDGMDLTKILTSRDGGPTQPDRVLYWENGANAKGTQAVRFGSWFGLRQAPEQPMELYNLDTDIECRNNLAMQQKEIVKKIQEAMAREHEASTWYPSTLDSAQPPH